MRFDPPATALVLVDLQNDFLHPDGAYGRAGVSAPEIAALPTRLKPVADAVRRECSAGKRDGDMQRYDRNADGGANRDLPRSMRRRAGGRADRSRRRHFGYRSRGV